jgi:hypothetical protein
MTDVPNMPPPPMVKINVEFEIGLHPKDCVLAVEHFTKLLCQKAKKEPQEAILMLLTAAVHMALAYSKDSAQVVLPWIGKELGKAAAIALEWWPLKEKKTILHSS